MVDSVFGVGAIVGGFYAIARAAGTARRRHGLGTVLWSLPLLLIVVWPSPASVFAAVVMMGFGNPLVDVNFATIVQRIVPEPCSAGSSEPSRARYRDHGSRLGSRCRSWWSSWGCGGRSWSWRSSWGPP